jgi:site-specific recombinase XerC
MIELADEEFMLVAAKALVDHAAEGLPIMRKMALNRLKPTSRMTDEMVSRDSYPDLIGDRVHFEVVLSAGDPQLRVVAIKLGEIHLRKTTEVEVMGKGSGCRIGWVIGKGHEGRVW